MLSPGALRAVACRGARPGPVWRTFRRSMFIGYKRLDEDNKMLLMYKRIFGIGFGGITLLFCAWLRKRKGDRLQESLRDCSRVAVEPGHYKDGVSMYRYHGYVIPGQIAQSGVLQQLPDFQFRETDVVVASFPKTGTTWVQEIVYMLTHGCRASTAGDETLETRSPYLEYPYPGLKTVANMAGQRCIKTHLPFSLLPSSIHSANTKIVYVTRNPRDTAVSYYFFMKLLTASGFIGNMNNFMDDFLLDKVPYAPFHSHVREYWLQRNEAGVLFISYEDITADPAEAVRKIAQHINIEVSDEDIQYVVYHTSFSVMVNNPSVNYEHWKVMGFAGRGRFLRNGRVGDWKNRLSEEEIARFEEWEKNNTTHGDCSFVYTFLPKEPPSHSYS